MKIVLAFDSFKGSLDAFGVVRAVRDGVQKGLPGAELVEVPLADGGEGTAALLTRALGGVMQSTRVTGPLAMPVEANWGWVADTSTAVIEMAEAAGLVLVPVTRRDPTATTTFGVGELIQAALDKGAKRIIMGLGGSATVDGGTGMAEALGVRFAGCVHPMTGGRLTEIKAVDVSGVDARLTATEIHVALDVANPLLGPHGAAAVFGPQKGATPEQVDELDQGLRHLSSFVPGVSPEQSGAGAAGGLGWGLAAFCGAELMSGIDLCLDTIGFDQLLDGADLVLTGEGSFDAQSLQGKVPIGVARRAVARGIPTAVLAGNHNVELASAAEYGIVAIHSIVKEFEVSVEHAVANAVLLLENLAERFAERLS